MYYGVVETPKFKRAFKLSCQTRGRITKRGNHNGTQADVGPVFHIYTAKYRKKSWKIVQFMMNINREGDEIVHKEL